MKKKFQPNIELIYDVDCPNVEATRQRLRDALTDLGQQAHWREWNRGNPSIPSYVSGYGSPTVLVDEKEVTGLPVSNASDSCRLYDDGAGNLSGVPSMEAIMKALRARSAKNVQSKWDIIGAVLGTLAASACCILPLGLLATGAAGTWATRLAVLEPYRPFFIALALMSLAFAFYRAYRPAKTESCAPHGSCKIPASRRTTRAALWMISPPLLLLLALPQLRRHVPGGVLRCGGAAGNEQSSDSGSCCTAMTNQSEPQATQPGDGSSAPLDPARDIVFKVQNLRCPAVKDVGCGSMLAPVLASLNQVEGISESFSDWTGERLRVSVAPGSDRNAVANKVQRLLSDDGREPIRLDAKELKQSKVEKWYTASHLIDLSSYEFRTVAKRRVNAFADSEGLEASRRQRLIGLVDELWDSAGQGIDPPGQKLGDYGQYWRSRIGRFAAAYLDRARDVVTPAQMERLRQVYSVRQS